MGGPMIVSRAMAAEIAGVRPATIRQWVHRGKLTDLPDGIDVGELIDWLCGESRSAAAGPGNRAARILAQALTLKRRKEAAPGDYETPDPGEWLRPRSI